MTEERREESHEQEPEIRQVQLDDEQIQEALQVETEEPPPPLDSDDTGDDIIKSRED